MAQFNIYEAVTARIIEQLEEGYIPWAKPWTGTRSGAVSGSTGKPYSLLNQMLLGKPGEYYTFAQVQAKGGKIRKNEKSHMVVFWKWIEEKDPETEEIKQIPFLRYYNVFHIDQCEGIQPRENNPHSPETDAEAESIIKRYTEREGLAVYHQKGDEAYYSPARDCVVLPLLQQFKSTAEYYSTIFHELTHSTGHSNRLNRLKRTAHFGSTDYSKEELTAEIGAAALLNITGTETGQSFRNNAAYIQNWLAVLKNDSRMIVSASGAAAKAVDFILG